MNLRLFATLIAPFLFLASSQVTASDNWKKGFVSNYMESCLVLNNATPVMVESFTPTEINSLCNCAANYVANNLTDQDFSTIFRSNSLESARPLIEKANNLCSKALLERKGLIGKPSTHNGSQNSIFPLYIRPPIGQVSDQKMNDLRQRAADANPLMSAFFSGAMKTMGISADLAAVFFRLVGLSDFARSLENAANKNHTEASRKPSLLRSSEIKTSGDIFIYLLANALHIVGFVILPGMVIFLVSLLLRARKQK